MQGTPPPPADPTGDGTTSSAPAQSQTSIPLASPPAAPHATSAPASSSSAAHGRSAPILRAPLLFLTVLAIATCGLIYELIAGTLSSYLLGDSVTQFSTVIGVYLSAMGLGSWLSKFLQKGLAHRFVDIELAVALVGGTSAPVLFLAFAHESHFRLVLYGVVTLIGTLVGLEIPLLLRILKNEFAFKDLVAQVLTFDYVGALFASLLFPLLLMPKLGLVRTSLLFGLINAGVGLWSTWLLQSQLGSVSFLRSRCLLVIAVLSVGMVQADRFTTSMEDEVYADEVIFSRTTQYQRIVITRGHGSLQLFLNGNLQFSSVDEYRYHEALVHPAFSVRPEAKRVLVCGGGDGLALREIVKYPQVQDIRLVDLDPEMTRLGSTMPLLTQLNHSSFSDPRVHVLNEDAMVWLNEGASGPEADGKDGEPATTARSGAGPGEKFDIIIVDFPDPNNFALGKLYTTRFYKLLKRVLAPGGIVVVQSTSPLFARVSFWCVAHTMEAAGYQVRPYHLAVPSFGEWGYVMAGLEPFPVPTHTRDDLKYLNDPTLQAMFTFPKDMENLPAEVNRLNNQVLVQYYDTEWKRLF